MVLTERSGYASRKFKLYPITPNILHPYWHYSNNQTRIHKKKKNAQQVSISLLTNQKPNCTELCKSKKFIILIPLAIRITKNNPLFSPIYWFWNFTSFTKFFSWFIIYSNLSSFHLTNFLIKGKWDTSSHLLITQKMLPKYYQFTIVRHLFHFTAFLFIFSYTTSANIFSSFAQFYHKFFQSLDQY